MCSLQISTDCQHVSVIANETGPGNVRKFKSFQPSFDANTKAVDINLASESTDGTAYILQAGHKSYYYRHYIILPT